MNRSSIKGVLITLLFLLLFSYGFSQNPVVKKIYTTAYAGKVPVIDGLMNDECWDLVVWGQNFIQSQPEENKPPTQETAFKILYDDENLYVLIRAFDTEQSKISRLMTRRDNYTGDMVEIDIDSYFDKQTAFAFTAMASGAKGDMAVTQGGNNGDYSWDPIWVLKTSIDEKGWTAEMKIPFSQLRFGKKDVQIWGIQVSRTIFRLQEKSTWQNIPKGSPVVINLFGELHGINNIKPRRHIELLPYVVAKTERFEKVEGNPFLTGKSNGLSAGLDGKIGITNDLTLDFTINPDFGQVEADPSEVNLTAFETYFSERRPFFVEGKNIYQFAPNQTIVINKMNSDNLFYSRRIGRFPHYYPSVSDSEYVKMPEATTILGAAKLSGKTKNGLSIGVMESVTSEEKATIDNEGIRRNEAIEPLTNYFVGRLQQDYNKGETVIGGIVTAVNRDINTATLNFLPTSAYTGGFDFQHYWKERTWYVAANTQFSNISGNRNAILNLQTSSARYYQRPDANYLGIDSALTALNGYGGTVKLGRSSKKNLQFETSLTVRSPGLEFNDIGYMRYSDMIHHGTWVAYYVRNPFLIFNNFFLNTNYWMYWNFSGKLLSFNTNMNFNTQFKNKWRLNGNITRQSKNTSTTLLRGGPSFLNPGNTEFNLNINTNQSKKIYFNAGFYIGRGDQNYYNNKEIWGGFTYRPFNALSVSMYPDLGIQNSKLQYITKISNNGTTEYVFGQISMKTMSVELRLNYTINPELTIEYYGYPFVSAAKYENINKITDPQGARFSDRYQIFGPSQINYSNSGNLYSIDENTDGKSDFFISNPDFNFRQYRSNMVLRWEYSPGSVMYLVWSQGRTSNASSGIFSYGRDIKDLFNAKATNIFLVKLTYWFSL
jgi:hypothetical protein